MDIWETFPGIWFFLLILQYQFALHIYNLITFTDVQNNTYHQNQNAQHDVHHQYIDVLNLAKLKPNLIFSLTHLLVTKKVILQNYDNITSSTPRGNLVSSCLAQAIAAKFFSWSLESSSISSTSGLHVSIIIFSNFTTLLIMYMASSMSIAQPIKPINSNTLRHWCGCSALTTVLFPSAGTSSSPINCHREEVKVLC